METSSVDQIDSNQDEGQFYHVFISHRKDDHKIAESLSSALGILGKYRLKVHCCEKIPGGEDWRDWIEEKIAKSNILVFLYTSEQADWRWCLYEIGLFRKPQTKQDGTLICIKNTDVNDLPSPIQQFQAYNSDKKGIRSFFEDLFFKGEFTKGVRLNDDLFTEYNQQLNNASEEIDKLYKPSRTEEIFYARRVFMDLIRSDDDRTEIEIDDAFINGDPVTMEILGVYENRVQFKTLYEKYKKQNNAKWLEQLRTYISELRYGDRPSGDMAPFTTRDGRKFIPVLSRVERIRAKQVDQPALTKRLYLILIQQYVDEDDCVPMEAGLPLKDVMDSWMTYLPCSVVRIRWHKKTGFMRYVPEDMDGEPVIYAINEPFSKLYVFKHQEFPKPDGPKPLTKEKLLRRLEEKGYMQSEYIEKVFQDQEEIGRAIIFEGRDGYAQAPLQFTDEHPYYPNESFLPCLVFKQVVGSESGNHETYLFIMYVRDFWPFDDPQNPYH